jgi:hypothetical protein
VSKLLLNVSTIYIQYALPKTYIYVKISISVSLKSLDNSVFTLNPVVVIDSFMPNLQNENRQNSPLLEYDYDNRYKFAPNSKSCR